MAEAKLEDLGRGRRGPRGERGHRGERGERGDRGHEGTTGPTGSIGSTGFTGPTGPTGTSPNGLGSYGYAAGIEGDTIAANADVDFDQGGLVFPHVGITPPSPGGTGFTVLSDGDYEYEFYVVGGHNNADTTSMVFGIFLDGVSPGAAHEFRSNQQASAADIQVVRGEGIINIGAGTTVTLRNRTGSGTIAVDVSAGAPGPEPREVTANRTLSLKKLSP